MLEIRLQPQDIFTRFDIEFGLYALKDFYFDSFCSSLYVLTVS